MDDDDESEKVGAYSIPTGTNYASLHLSMTRNISWKQNNLVVTEVHAHILG
jgi:hypothetical protein